MRGMSGMCGSRPCLESEAHSFMYSISPESWIGKLLATRLKHLSCKDGCSEDRMELQRGFLKGGFRRETFEDRLSWNETSSRDGI
jgi:hypothetical protein